MDRSFFPYQRQVDALKEKNGYVILDQIGITDYDTNWQNLEHRLAQSKRDHYLPSEKYAVHHHDTEYFLGEVGFTIENFNRVISSLDIDPCRFVIFTNHRGSTHRWLSYCPDPNNQFQVIETPWTRRLRYDDCSIMPMTTCDYNFCCVMGAGRTHRDKLSHWIIDNNLQNNNLVVYHRTQPSSSAGAPVSVESVRGNHYVSTVPFTRINELWSNKSRFQSGLAALHDHRIPAHQPDQKFLAPWYAHTLMDLVAETVFHYPHAYISEKTIRPILHGRPFLIVGASFSLRWLQEMGFRTFDAWWDESYDAQQDPDARLDSIFRTVMEISSWSKKHCEHVWREMIPVLEHNQVIYKGLSI